MSSTQQLNFSIDGRQQFVQITPLQDNKGLDWLIVTVIPEADFLAQINANARTTILLCLAALVLAILSGLYTSRWISRPILRLNQASKAIAAGDLEQQVEVTGIDELEQLSQSFNRMASQLNQSFSTLEQTNTALEQANDELERRVEERTTELKQAKETSDGVNRTLQQRVIELLQEVDPISKGDLTVRAKVTADEIGTIADSYNATVENLRKIVVQVQQAANQMANTTSNSQASVQELSEEALRQAEAIASALQVIQDMAKAVQDVSMNAKQAEVAMQQATLTVEAGDVAMNRTVEGMQAIRATVAETAKKVKHLGESSQKISSVIELISAFAEQTKLLSLNASIEAALAGEEGRGFGMVANEVRALARRSAEATEEIRKLVMEIQAETNEVVAAMESGTQQVVIGTQLVDETRQSLNQITAVSTQISQLVEGIAQATIVQSQASEIVSQMMQDVVAIASKTSVEANQVASSFEQLREVAETLQMGVGQFKV
ncbi:MAG: methyl-accepting chemotaxis protein [Cyanobacteria bacterium RU_5_0]|nr:methyl-accepting chemotaxis protein [Cyanobacteria bacterium RU_5_0]